MIVIQPRNSGNRQKRTKELTLLRHFRRLRPSYELPTRVHLLQLRIPLVVWRKVSPAIASDFLDIHDPGVIEECRERWICSP